MKVVRIILQIIGALALLAVIALVFLAWRQFTHSSKFEDPDDVRAILARADFDPDQKWKLIDGHESPRNITGDHVDFACMQLSEGIPPGDTAWQPTPEMNPVFRDALEQSISWAKSAGARCVPSFESANSHGKMLRFLHLETRDRATEEAQVFIFDSATRQLFYVSFAT